MLEKGLEPLCLAAYEPESYVSTNFTTRATLYKVNNKNRENWQSQESLWKKSIFWFHYNPAGRGLGLFRVCNVAKNMEAVRMDFFYGKSFYLYKSGGEGH